MDTIDYNQKEKEILSVIPKHFHSTLSYMAYERGRGRSFRLFAGFSGGFA